MVTARFGTWQGYRTSRRDAPRCARRPPRSGISGSVFAVADAELGPFFRQVDDLSRQVEAARVAILAEALTRGVLAQSVCPSAASWVPLGPVLPRWWGRPAGGGGPGCERELGGA